MARIQLEGILKLIDVDINPAIFQKISRAVSNLPIALQQTGRAAQNAQGHMQGLTGAVSNTNKQLSLGASFATKFLQRMAQFAILLPIFATLNKALQGSVKFMTEFESELLNIARVDPTATVEKLSRISAVALDIGVQFGASSLEVLKTVKVFVQAGESIESALEKARVATLATQVSTLDLVQAQELLIGVSKQFRDEALADIDILDKVAKVEDQSAADAAELAEAFVTGGNAIAFATKSFDDSIGIIAALREQTRKSGREIGTFLKTLATRILAAGESRSALEQLGVVVEDQAGNLRPLLAILKDTKLAFDGLTESEAANAAKAIGGVRQFESLLATLQSLEKAQELSASSTRSQGAADQKLSIVQEKLSFQVGQTVSEFQKLAVMLGDNGMLDFFKEGVKALRLFAIGLEGAVDLADSLGVSLVPLLAAGGFKIGQIAFGGRNKQQQVQNQGPMYQPQFQGTGYGSRSAFRNMAYQRSQSTNFIGSNANPNTNADAMKFVALQSAAVAAGLALKGLEKAFADSTGSMEILGNTTKDTVGAMQTAFQVSAVLGPKAGAFAGALDIIVASSSRIIDAFDERSKDLAEIDANTKNFKSTKGLNLDAQAGQVLTMPIIKAMADAFNANGGQIGDAFFKSVDVGIKQVVGNKKLLEDAGLANDKNIGSLNLENLLGDTEWIKSVAAAHPEFERLNYAIENNMSLSQRQVALFRDVGAAQVQANKTLEEFAFSLRDIGQRSQLRQQEAAINDLLRERMELQRTDIPLFQSEIEILRERQKLLSQGLDTAGAAKKDFLDTARKGPAELGFIGKKEDATKRAEAFINSLEEAFNNAGKDGKFNLEGVISNIAKQTRVDSQFGTEEAVPVSQEEQAKMLEAAQKFVEILTEAAKRENELIQIESELRTASRQNLFDLGKKQQELDKIQKDSVNNLRLSFIKLGADADISASEIEALADLSSEDLKDILAGSKTASASLKDLLETFMGDDLQKAQQAARISSETFAIELESLDESIRAVTDDIATAKTDVSGTSGKRVMDLEQELGQLQIQRLAKVREAEQETLKNSLAILRARDEAEKKAAELAKETAKAMDALAASEFALKNGIEDANKSFREFTEQTMSDMLQEAAQAQSNLSTAQGEVISTSSALADSYQGLKDAIMAFNDSMAAAQIEAGLLGIEMEALDGGLNTISSRVGALNQVFNSAIKDANISLKERIALERQLATETLQFLQNARNEITNAGLEVFGQSPEENADLQQGIQGLEYVADKLGGSFDNFSNMNPQEFDKVSRELLSLPTEFRQQILDALRTLPSTANIGGFSVEQLQNALGQVGAGVNAEAGLPAIAELLAQEKEQMTKLQDLAIQDAELQISQVVASIEQVELAKTALEAAQIQADRASEELVTIQEQLISENEALVAAADQREKLTAQLLAATDNATIRAIEAQAREFANQVPLFQDISAKLLEVVQSIGSLKAAQFSASENIPVAGRGWIPNYASGRLNAKEAYGLLRAGAREKRMMPAGAGLAVANTSETIIPSRFRGQIPNFAGGTGGSQIATGIQAINGTNAAIVAAITNSINSLINKTDNGAQQDLDKLTLDKLDNILSTLQEISLSNSTISNAVNTEESTQTGAAVQPININVNSNGKSEVRVTGLDNLEKDLRAAITRAQTEQAEQVLAPVNSAVEAIFRVLRERNLMSSFGQGQ